MSKFKVGDRVCIRPDLEDPEYGWGAMLDHRAELGTVHMVDPDEAECCVRFPHMISWSALDSELLLLDEFLPNQVVKFANDVSVDRIVRIDSMGETFRLLYNYGADCFEPQWRVLDFNADTGMALIENILIPHSKDNNEFWVAYIALEIAEDPEKYPAKRGGVGEEDD